MPSNFFFWLKAGSLCTRWTYLSVAMHRGTHLCSCPILSATSSRTTRLFSRRMEDNRTPIVTLFVASMFRWSKIGRSHHNPNKHSQDFREQCVCDRTQRTAATTQLNTKQKLSIVNADIVDMHCLSRNCIRILKNSYPKLTVQKNSFEPRTIRFARSHTYTYWRVHRSHTIVWKRTCTSHTR